MGGGGGGDIRTCEPSARERDFKSKSVKLARFISCIIELF